MSTAENLSNQYDDLVRSFESHEIIHRAVLDPYVLIDKSHQIVQCNDMFLEMSGAASFRDILGQPLDSVIEFQLQNKPLLMPQIFTPGPNRLDEIHLKATHANNQVGGIIIIGSIPIKSNNDILGYFALIRDVTKESSLQVEYERKFLMSVTDVLTGMRNRAFLQQYLQTQFSLYKSNPKHQGFCALMSDIDHFKKINDTHGHQAGDFVLKNVAQVISQSVRKTDVVCRYGGEEFLITLNDISEDAALLVAEKIRYNIANASFVFDGKSIPVTSSFGLSHIRPSDKNIEELVKRADGALYQSKHAGRNRVSKA